MCGIVGYSGFNDAVHPVIEGLTRLEYRGYDSAGISILSSDHSSITVLKKEGKLENLKKILAQVKPVGSTAIGHTRWATHGQVNDTNAHPHANDQFSIVHNGIIENAYQLKKNLQLEGCEFLSETDSEVFLVLLTQEYKKNKNLKEAILTIFQKLHGNSAFVIMSKFDNTIFAIRRGAPLVCGERIQAKGAELFISSDPYALVGHVDTIYFPEDNVLCELNQRKNAILFSDLKGNPSEAYRKEAQSADLEISKKGQFEHFMLKEIFEQPTLVSRLLQHYTSLEGKEILKQYLGKKFTHIHIVACGTAWHAGLCMKTSLEKQTGTRVSVELASEFRYRNPLLATTDLCLLISQSGETADTLACAQMCKDLGLHLISIVNVKGSSLYRLSHANLLIKAGQEIGVASTKAFTLQVLTGELLALTLGGKTISSEELQEFNLLEERMQELLMRHHEITDIAKSLYQKKGFIFIGRGMYFPIALEGALKLKEIAYVHAEGYAAGELKHGPIALIDENMASVALLGPEMLEKSLSNAEEVRARKGIIFAIGPKNNPEVEKVADYFLALNFEGLNNYASLYVNTALQLFSYEIARLKGTDIDRPRNLAKSVTVE